MLSGLWLFHPFFQGLDHLPGLRLCRAIVSVGEDVLHLIQQSQGSFIGFLRKRRTAQRVQPFTTYKEGVGQCPFRLKAQRPLAQILALAQPALSGQAGDLQLLFLRYADLDPRIVVSVVGGYRLLSNNTVFLARSAIQGVRGMCPLKAGKPRNANWTRRPAFDICTHKCPACYPLRQKKDPATTRPPSAYRRRHHDPDQVELIIHQGHRNKTLDNLSGILPQRTGVTFDVNRPLSQAIDVSIGVTSKRRGTLQRSPGFVL